MFQKRCELEVVLMLFLPWPKDGFASQKHSRKKNFEREVPKSTRYKNKWALGNFEDWQRVRSVKFPILEVGGVF